jgi:hypothetical protein
MAQRSRSWTLQVTALIGVLLLAALLRLWQIDTIPPGFHFDEAFEGLEAWRIFTDPTYRPIFLTGNFGVPPFNAYANALAFAIAEALGVPAGPTVMRTTAALFGLLGVVAIFALAGEMRRAAPDRLSPAFPWLAAAALAGMRWHVHFSRMGIEPILVPLLWTSAAWLLLRAWRTGAWWAYGALGLVLALGMYVYQAAWFIPWLIAATALHLLLAAPANPAKGALLPRNRRGLALAAGVAVVGILPLVRFFWEQPDLLWMRPAQIAIVGQTASPADDTLGAALWATAKMFGPFGTPGDLDPRRNLPGAPALNLWEVLPFYMGLGLALRNLRRPVMALPLIGLVGLLLPGVISEYAPHFHRVLGAAAPAALCMGIGLDWIWRTPARWITARPAQLAGPILALLLLTAGTVTSAQLYFVRWAALPDLFYAFDEGLWELGQWVGAQPGDAPIYISPQGDNHPTLAFAWRPQPDGHTADAPPQPVRFDGRTIFPLTAGANAQSEQYAVIEHEDWRTPLLLPEVLPSAAVIHQILDPAGAVYAQVYRRPPGTLPARPPQIPLTIDLGDGIGLVGYDLQPQPLHRGASLYLQLHWLVDAPPTGDWTVFTHLLATDGSLAAGFDSRPGRGALPTTHWQAGWRILDEYEIILPVDFPPGQYHLHIGLYRPDGARMPATPAGLTLGLVEIYE